MTSIRPSRSDPAAALPRRDTFTATPVARAAATLLWLASAAASAQDRAGGQQRRDVGTWGAESSPRGWNSHNWPTMVPGQKVLSDYLAVTDEIVR